MDRQERQPATAFARCHDSSPANATHSLAGQYPASQLSRSTIRHSLPAPHSVSCPTSRALKGHPFHRLAAAGGSLNLSSPAEPRTTACRRPLRRRRSARSTRGRRGLFGPTDNDARQQPALLAASPRHPAIRADALRLAQPAGHTLPGGNRTTPIGTRGAGASECMRRPETGQDRSSHPRPLAGKVWQHSGGSHS